MTYQEMLEKKIGVLERALCDIRDAEFPFIRDYGICSKCGTMKGISGGSNKKGVGYDMSFSFDLRARAAEAIEYGDELSRCYHVENAVACGEVFRECEPVKHSSEFLTINDVAKILIDLGKKLRE